MADENVRPGMVGGLAQLAYGGGESPMAQVPALLDKMLPASSDANEWLAYGAGVGAPTRSGALTEAMANGMGQQLDARNTRDKLRAAYMPLIMDAILKNQQMTLAGATAGRDYLKDIVPKIDSHLSSMRTGDAKPTHEQVSQRLLQLGQEYQVPAPVLYAKLNSLPKDPDAMAEYLDRLAAGTAGADKQIPTAGTNAAGQTTITNANRGTTRVAAPEGMPPAPGPEGAPASAAGAGGANPTNAFVDWEKNTRGDVKGFEEGLRARVDAYRTMMARMNEQSDYINKFQPGRYAKMAGGAAAAVKDIGTRLPGVDPKTVEDIAAKLVGSKEGSPQALAAQQMFEQLAQQESLAQLKSALGEGQRMNMMEYANFAKVNLGQTMDPETFKATRNFYTKQAADAVNRYKSWADYVNDPKTTRPSVTHFDATHTKNEFDKLLAGRSSVLSDSPEATRPSYPPSPGGAAPAEPPAPAKNAPPASAADTDLSLYEPGAKTGPTGKVYVLENGSARPARLRAKPNPGAVVLPVSLGGKGPGT